MRLGVIALKIRAAGTIFGNYVAGSAELEVAFKNTLKQNCAFVIPRGESSGANNNDVGINQSITERFAVVVAIGNDTTDKGKTGVIAYDNLHDARAELLKVLVNWDLGYESTIRYTGGSVVDINPAYLWYMFEFAFDSRIVSDLDGFAEIEVREVGDRQQRSQLDDFDHIYSNIILSPSGDLPYTGDLPLPDDFPDVTIPDMATWIDFTENPNAGDFWRSFSKGFKLYTEED